MTRLRSITSKNYPLPSEAEWEYASRGGSASLSYKYLGSNLLNEVAWYKGNSGGKTYSVGQKKANELGLFDMSGNVWEYCQNWYVYFARTQFNPTVPSMGSYRVIRGDGWFNIALACRISNRTGNTPLARSRDIGFRLVRTP